MDLFFKKTGSLSAFRQVQIKQRSPPLARDKLKLGIADPMNWGLERSLGHVEMVEDRRILSTLAQRKKPNKQTWTTTWKRSVTFLPQAPMSLSCLHQNREGCSQCQGLCLRLFLGSGRTGLALPLGLPERVSQRLGCLAEVWVCADLAKGAAWALQCSKA